MTRPTILDGGMGQELIRRGAPRSAELWSAWAMLEDPGLVTAIHADYVAAQLRADDLAEQKEHRDGE